MDTSLIQEYNVDKDTFRFEKSWTGQALGSNTIYVNHNGLSLIGENWGIDGITLENIYLFDNNLCVGLNCGSLLLNQLSFEKQNNYSLYSILNESGKDGDIYFPNSIINGITSGNSAHFYALISNIKLAEKDNELISGNFIIKLESENNIIFQNLTPSYNLTSLKLYSLTWNISLNNFITTDYNNGANVKINIVLLSGNIKLYKQNNLDPGKISNNTIYPIFIKSITKKKISSNVIESVINDNIFIKKNNTILFDKNNLFFNETYEYTVILKNYITGEETNIKKSILTVPAPLKNVYIERTPTLSLRWDYYSFMNENNINHIIYTFPYDISGVDNNNNIYTTKGEPFIITTKEKLIKYTDLLPGIPFKFNIDCKNNSYKNYKKCLVNTSLQETLNIEDNFVDFNLSLYKENNLYKVCIDLSGEYLFSNNDPTKEYIIYDRYKKIETISVDNIENNKIFLNTTYEELPELYINIIATNFENTIFSSWKQTKVVNSINDEIYQLPSAPILFKANGKQNEIVLSWQSNNNYNVCYSIYKIKDIEKEIISENLILIKSFIETLSFTDINLLDETTYNYAIKSYNQIGEYSTFSYANATTLEYKEPSIFFKVRTFINSASLIIKHSEHSLYTPHFSIFCLYKDKFHQLIINSSKKKFNISNLAPNTEYSFILKYWFKNKNNFKTSTITKRTLSNYNKNYSDVVVFKNVLKETNLSTDDKIFWCLKPYQLYNYNFLNFTMLLPSHFYIKWKEYLINPLNPTIITLKNEQPYLNFVNGDIIAVFSLQNKVCLDAYVWNENDVRKTLYCSQSKEKYGISKNDTNLSFQVWRSSSGIIEPLFVCEYELLNEKMQIVETNSNLISIIKNGPLEGIYNNIVLKPCDKNFKIYKNGIFYSEISYKDELNYFYNLSEENCNYMVTHYYSVSGDCYSYNYKEHYESNVWENIEEDFSTVNLNVNIETKRQINVYNEIKTKQNELLPNTWNLLSFNLLDNNSNTVQSLLNNMQYENNTLVVYDEKYNYYYSENGLWKPEENSFINFDKCYYIKHFGQQKRYLSITGNLIQDKFYKFSKGWNLISFPFGN